MRFHVELEPYLHQVEQFEKDVLRNIIAFVRPTVFGLRRELTAVGAAQLRLLHFELQRRYLSGVTVDTQVLDLLLERHIARWQLTINGAFQTALESVPEVNNPFRAKVAPGGPRRTILARLTAAVARSQTVDEPVRDGDGRVLYGRVRATRGPGRREWKMRLSAYLRLVVRQTPINFQREWIALLLKILAPIGQEPVYRLTNSVSERSCKTCRALRGRVLTASAVRFAATRLKPVLFHPHCVHNVTPQGLLGVSVEGYDPNKHGQLVTTEVIISMIRAGVLEEKPASPAFINL